MIPFHEVYNADHSTQYVQDSITGHISGDGPYTRKCETFLTDLTSAKKVLLTPSCSIALDMCAMLIDAGPEDEIIVPSYTFVTTANAFHNFGAKLVFVDVDPVTLNIDIDQVEKAITPKTKAIVPVHYNGIGCDMMRLMSLAEEHGLYVVEDAAQAVDAYQNDRHLGTFGHLATFSFHQSKNIVCGEGGALVINDERFMERAEIIREKGTNRKQFFRGEFDKYTWHDKGSSYVMSDMLAAFLWGQLELCAEIKEKRKFVYEAYTAIIKDTALRHTVIPQGSDPSYHLFYVILPQGCDRMAVMSGMKDNGVQTAFHYVPLHTSPVGLSLGGKVGTLPVTEDLSTRLLRLPLYPGLNADDVQKITEVLMDALSKYSG